MPLPFSVLYEDNHLLIVNKAPGVLVQGDATGDPTLLDYAKGYLKEKYHKPGDVFLGLVHRLDRPVSGIVVLARTSKALERMNRLFKDRKTQKVYCAIVHKRPANPEDVLVNWLKKDERANRTVAYTTEREEALRSELRYELVMEKNGYFLLRVEPVTGRPHQIRVQLAAIGCTIQGDVKYGSPSGIDDGSIYLHAAALSFEHPVKKEQLRIAAPFRNYGLWKLFSDYSP